MIMFIHMQVAFAFPHRDALVVRNACLALQKLESLRTELPASTLHTITRQLMSVIIGNQLPSSGWFSAAEAAFKALYSLHQAPSAIASCALRLLAADVLQGAISFKVTRLFFESELCGDLRGCPSRG